MNLKQAQQSAKLEAALAQILARAGVATTGGLPVQTAAGNGPPSVASTTAGTDGRPAVKSAPARSKTVPPSPAEDHATGPQPAAKEGQPDPQHMRRKTMTPAALAANRENSRKS